ncbi:unnamed protein product [Musa banksii]
MYQLYLDFLLRTVHALILLVFLHQIASEGLKHRGCARKDCAYQLLGMASFILVIA